MNILHSHLEHPHDEKRLGRRARVLIAAFVGLFSAFSCGAVLVHQPTWPAAIAVSAEAAVVITFCYLMLRRD
ncbi:MAG: hypothetical protein HYY23_09120 [Verrucomicrobia bacterium]|nr:hypothetical protein [Verrucomicrobiota bacterium]